MTKRIYKRSMAEFLIDNGCTFIKTVPDVSQSWLLNWVFEDNEQLAVAMTKYTKRLRAKR